MLVHATHSKTMLSRGRGEKEKMKLLQGSKRRILALLLALAIILLALPLAAISAQAEGSDSSTKTVYFTLVNDGAPVVGNDDNKTVLSHLKVEVPYFDLERYDLTQYYRYESDSFEEGGKYNSSTVLEQPTVLHLYIYMLEKYCIGLPEDQCMRGGSQLWQQANECFDIFGRSVNSKEVQMGDEYVKQEPLNVLKLTGAATSMYMVNYWGHDENLMYYIDHQYPLMAAGWGSTADYILLEDGMTIDVAMFSDWSFWHDGGAFGFFDRDEYYVERGKAQDFYVYRTMTIACNDGSSYISDPLPNMDFLVYPAGGTADQCGEARPLATSDEKGKITYTFSETGDYEIVAEDPKRSSDDARIAPATAIVHVMDYCPPLNSVTLNVHEAALDPAEPLTLKATIDPVDVPGVTYKWESSDPEVAHVSEIGVVKTYIDGKGGTATITCTATDSLGKSVSDSCVLTVKGGTAVESVSLPETMLNLKMGDKYQLVPTVLPENASQKTVQWRTSECPDFEAVYSDADYKILKVDQNGNVVLKAPGVVTVTCKTDNGDLTATCRIAVSSDAETNRFGVLTEGGTKPSAFDATIALRSLTDAKAPLTDRQKMLGDIDGDSKITAYDAACILRYTVTGKFQ